MSGRCAPARLRLAQLLCNRLQPFGAARIGNRLYPFEHGRRDNYRFTVRAKTGSEFSGSTADVHAHPFAVTGCGEWRNWAIALAVCRPGELVVEIGANVGTETVGFSDIVGPGGRVVAFEPLPAHVQMLRGVLKGFRYDNVVVLPYALSDREGPETFAVPAASMSQGIGHLLGPEERDTGTASYYNEPANMSVIDVETRKLDSFASELRGLRLLVADAEGSELLILRGATRVLADERPVLVVEASKPHQRRAGFGIEQLRDALTGLRYEVFEVGALKLKRILDPNAGPPQANWLCVPAEKAELVPRVERLLRRCALTPCGLGLNPLTGPARR